MIAFLSGDYILAAIRARTAEVDFHTLVIRRTGEQWARLGCPADQLWHLGIFATSRPDGGLIFSGASEGGFACDDEAQVLRRARRIVEQKTRRFCRQLARSRGLTPDESFDLFQVDVRSADENEIIKRISVLDVYRSFVAQAHLARGGA